MAQEHPSDVPTIALVGADTGFLAAVAAALGPVRSVSAVVIPEAIEQAARRPELDAAAVIVATDRDDSAVLVTLTARELDPTATIVAAAREEENLHLLKQSGADSVILSSGAAGRLLGQAVHSPRTVEVLEDLLSVGSGLDLVEREVGSHESGRAVTDVYPGEPILAIIRGDELLRFDDERVATVREGDRVICLCANDDVEISG